MIFDGRSDMFTDVTVRRLKGETQVLINHHLPRLRKGNIEGGCFVLWIDPPYDAAPAKRLGELMHCIKDEMAECEEAVVVKNLKEIEEARKEKSRAYHRNYSREYRARNLEKRREYDRIKAREYREKKKAQAAASLYSPYNRKETS